MSDPTITRLADPEAVARHVAARIAAAAAEARAQRGEAHICLAGGTTPMRAYELLGPLLDDWNAVHFWYGDERCVEPDHPDSNHGQTIARLVAPGATFHRMRGEVGASQGAREYLADLGDTVLDLTSLGMGPDGHTASLFPNHLLLAASAPVAAITDSPKPPPERITLTLAAINASLAILLAVTGADKAPALARALGDPDPGTPVSLLARDRLEIACDDKAWPEE